MDLFLSFHYFHFCSERLSKQMSVKRSHVIFAADLYHTAFSSANKCFTAAGCHVVWHGHMIQTEQNTLVPSHLNSVTWANYIKKSHRLMQEQCLLLKDWQSKVIWGSYTCKHILTKQNVLCLKNTFLTFCWHPV